MGDDVAKTAELLVSELVTNGVKASQVMDQVPPVWLRLSSDNVRVLIELWDGNPRPPIAKELSEDGIPDVDEESGRGLFLVATLSQRWNWYTSRAWGGKVVWCEIAAARQRLDAMPGTDGQAGKP